MGPRKTFLKNPMESHRIGCQPYSSMRQPCLMEIDAQGKTIKKCCLSLGTHQSPKAKAK